MGGERWVNKSRICTRTFIKGLALRPDSFVEVEVGDEVNVLDSVGGVYEEVFAVRLQFYWPHFPEFVDEQRKVKMKVVTDVAPVSEGMEGRHC